MARSGEGSRDTARAEWNRLPISGRSCYFEKTGRTGGADSCSRGGLDMNQRLRSLAIAASILVGMFPGIGRAWSDSDADLIRDEVDNCQLLRNGPNDPIDQTDCDADGYGNRCDADYDQDLSTTPADFGFFLGQFGEGFPSGTCVEADHDGDGAVTPADFAVFLTFFGREAPGRSGLLCAGSVPCLNFVRMTTSGTVDTPGLPNDVRSPSDYDVVAVSVPPGHPGSILFFRMVAGAPGGQCTGGAQCYADGRYALAGWADLAEAEASPTLGTLFHLDVTDLLDVVENIGPSNGGVAGGPTFPRSLLSVEYPGISGPSATCPATGCVVALISDVGEAPNLVVETRTSTLPLPAGTPVDHALCPVGCEGGLPVGTAAVELILVP